MRELEFSYYLKEKYSRRTATNYMSYCRAVEKSFGGKDLDDIIVNLSDLVLVKDKLKENGYSSGYITGFNLYLDFALSSGKNRGIIYAPKSEMVSYEFSYPAHDREYALCDFLAEEYSEIRNFAKKIFTPFFLKLPEIPIYLSKEQPLKTYCYSTEFIMGKIEEFCSRCNRNCKSPYCPLREILKRYEPFTVPVLGRFFSGISPNIVIYVKNFENSKMANEKFLAEITQTLAHEYMHCLHCHFAGDEFAKADSKLKEALADFFGVLYSVNRGTKFDLKVAEERYRQWQRHKDSNWPYAYAAYFLNNQVFSSSFADYENNGCINKLTEIFSLCRSSEDALNELIK